MNKRTYKDVLDNIYDGVYFVDRERRITYWNHGAENITGYPFSQIVGRFCHDNILNHVTENGVQLCQNGCPLHATLQDGMPRQAELYFHHADGHRVPVLVRTSPMKDGHGEIIGAVEIFSDNTPLLSTRLRVHTLEKTVLLDPLTGVGNRRHMEIKLRSAISEFQQHRIPYGVLFVDIDQFKKINDSHGHDYGDHVLRMVANTLKNSLRLDDIVARWGGEEFVALIANVNLGSLCATAEKLRMLVEQSSIRLDNNEIKVTISVGGTIIRFEDDLASVIRRADQYMYQSKQAGRNRVICDPDGKQ